MSKIIQIESANMEYDDDYNVKEVEIEYRYRGKVMRSGRGSIKMNYEDFKDKADVDVLEGVVKDEIKSELDGLKDDGRDDKEDDKDD